MRSIVFGVILLLVFLVPWENMITFAEFGTLARWIGYFAALLAVLSMASDMSLRRAPSAFVILVIYWLWALFSYAWSLDTESSTYMLPTVFSLMVFTWLVMEFARSWRQQVWLMRAYLFGCVLSLIMLIIGFVSISGSWWASKMRYSAAGLNVNYLADMVIYGIPIAIYLASKARESIRLLYWLYVPTAIIGALLSGSRAVALGLVVIAALVVLKSLRARWGTMLMVVICGVSSIMLIPRVVPTHLMDRILSVGEVDFSEGKESRLVIWQRGWQTFQQYPLTGVGIGAYGTVTIGSPHFPAHNVFLSVLVETGLIGFMLYMLFLGMLTYNIWKLPKAERTLWSQVLAVWIVLAATAPNDFVKSTWFIYGIILSQSVFFRSLRSQINPIPLKWQQLGRRYHGASG